MKNFERVCVRATFYDSDNMVVTSASKLFPQIQHGTTVWFGFNNLYEVGAGKNKATRHELVAYQLESKSVMDC